MIDLSEEEVEWNIETTAKYLKRAAPMKQWLEMEIGITGGEEDGVNNESVDNASLYTQPEDIYNIYKTLSAISPYFSIAAGFGNVHGVYVSSTDFLFDFLTKVETRKRSTSPRASLQAPSLRKRKDQRYRGQARLPRFPRWIWINQRGIPSSHLIRCCQGQLGH
jgi:hypothetical protein